MNRTSLAISALAIVAATAMGFYGFLTTQSAAAQTNSYNTNNAASQSATETGTATGGTAGNNGAASGGFVSQGICQQIAQSGAFGSSENEIEKGVDCS
jgi:hypothetical protein